MVTMLGIKLNFYGCDTREVSQVISSEKVKSNKNILMFQ